MKKNEAKMQTVTFMQGCSSAETFRHLDLQAPILLGVQGEKNFQAKFFFPNKNFLFRITVLFSKKHCFLIFFFKNMFSL